MDQNDDIKDFARQADGTYNVNGDMFIGEVIAAFPQVAGVMLSYGLHCVGCHANTFDTIEGGSRGHGMSDEEIALMIEEINEIINKRIEIVELTVKAIEMTKELRAKEGKDSMALRVKAFPGDKIGYEMDFDDIKTDDIQVKYDALIVVIDPESLLLLKGSSIDYIDTYDGGGYRIINPNSKG